MRVRFPSPAPIPRVTDSTGMPVEPGVRLFRGGDEGDFVPVQPPDILRMILHEGAVLHGDSDVFEGDVPGIGAGDAIGAGEIEIVEGDILDGAFFETFNRATPSGAGGGDVINVDVAELRGALGERLHRGFGVAQGKHDGGANVPEMDVGGNDVFDDTAATAGALDPDAVVGAVTTAVDEADVADPGGLFAANGADAVAMGDMATEVGDILGGTIQFPAFFIAAGLDSEGVITHVGIAIMHHDVAAGVGIQGIGVGGRGWVDHFAVTDVDVLAVKQVDGPEGGIDEVGAIDADAVAVLDLNQHRAAADGAVGAGIAVLGHVHGCPPGEALSVKGAGARDGDVVEAVGEEERMGTVFGETFPTRGDVGIFGPVCLEENHRAAVNLEGHVVHHVDGPGQEMTGGNPDDAAPGFLAIGDGPAERVGTGNIGIVHGTVVGDGEDGPGRRPGSDAPVFSGHTPGEGPNQQRQKQDSKRALGHNISQVAV